MACIVHDGLRCCVDCLAFAANGDIPEDRPELPEVLRVAFPGLHLVPAGVGDNYEGEGFSWSACDCCGSRLGGDRWLMATLGPGDEVEAIEAQGSLL